LVLLTFAGFQPLAGAPMVEATAPPLGVARVPGVVASLPGRDSPAAPRAPAPGEGMTLMNRHFTRALAAAAAGITLTATALASTAGAAQTGPLPPASFTTGGRLLAVAATFARNAWAVGHHRLRVHPDRALERTRLEVTSHGQPQTAASTIAATAQPSPEFGAAPTAKPARYRWRVRPWSRRHPP